MLKVLVIGSTGQQGGSVARLLLKHGHQVRAFTRRPESAPAQELLRQGAELVQGDLNDLSSIERAMQGTDAVFGVATPYERGPEAEERNAQALVNAAKAMNVKHLLYSSVADADRATGIPHFENKARVEEHIRALGLPYTIIAPAFFFENYLSSWFLPDLKQGRLSIAMPPDRPLQMIALENIGEFAVHVLENRERFLNQRINLAADELSNSQVAEIISRLSGKPITYQQLANEQIRSFSDDLARMYDWFDRVGYSVNLERLRRDYPQINWLRFPTWAEHQDWSILK